MGEPVKEAGPWESGYNVFAKHAYVKSNDFTHDVRLIVNGDFANTEQKLAYAAEIARRLNEFARAEKAEQENARLRAALAAETERCAQVALSYWEYHKKAYLHHIGHWQAAADYHLQLQAAGSQIADRIRARTALGGE